MATNGTKYLDARQIAATDEAMEAGLSVAKIEMALGLPRERWPHAIRGLKKTKHVSSPMLVNQCEKKSVPRFVAWVSGLPDDYGSMTEDALTAKGTTSATSAMASATTRASSKTPAQAQTQTNQTNQIPSPSPDGQPMLVVPVMEFVAACHKSIANARGVTRYSGNPTNENLMRYGLEVEVAGVVATMRLDLACALTKRSSRLPRDAYGDEILGAMLSPNGRHWVIAYDVSRQLDTNSPDAGNIDHLIPRSGGGESVLCNLHVMRVSRNSRKSSDAMPDVSGEPQESIDVLLAFARGCRAAVAEGRMSKPMAAQLESILHEELVACLTMLRTDERVALKVRLTGRQLVATIRSRISSVASSVVSAAMGAPDALRRQTVPSALADSLMASV